MAWKQMSEIAYNVTEIRNYVINSKDCSEKDLLRELSITQNKLYQLLVGLKDDPQVCCDGKEYYIRKNGKRLGVKAVDKYLGERGKKATRGPERAERLLYLYNILHDAIPDGGISFNKIRYYYLQLMGHYGEYAPGEAALKRMIYRDIESLEVMNIFVERPSTGARKYCLRESYLPKLPLESATILYATMLLYRGTLLHQAMDASRQQIEKSFFKNIPERADIIKQRIYVVGDTLKDSNKFGDNLGKLMLAVIGSMRIRMDYINNRGEFSSRIIDPLGIIFKRAVWYLVAKVSDSDNYRTFRVDQIQALTVRETDIFEYPDGFSLQEHISASWGVYCNDPVQKVTLHFSPRVAMRVKNLRYHPSERLVKELPDGSVILQYEVRGLIEMLTWIIQWGKEVKVLEPEELQYRLKELARDIYELY